MLNKIVKLIGIGVIIGLNGLKTWGNRIDVIREDYPIYVVEGKDGIELPEELSDANNSELWYEYDPLVDFVGIRLNFPEEIIERCEDKYWEIRDKNKIQELEEVVSTEENFYIWCDKQEEIPYPNNDLICTYAFVLKKVNEKNYLIPWNFASRIKLGEFLEAIYDKGFIHCMRGLYPNNPTGRYLRNFGFGCW